MSDPHRDGRWGVRQYHKGRPTGGGTVGLGWDTREEAEAANPPRGDYSYEPFERWDAEADRARRVPPPHKARLA